MNARSFFGGREQENKGSVEEIKRVYGLLIDGVEILTDQLNYTYEKYKKSDDFRNTMLDDFCNGVEVCREQVLKMYPKLDFSWLDDGRACSQGNELGVVIVGGTCYSIDLNNNYEFSMARTFFSFINFVYALLPADVSKGGITKDTVRDRSIQNNIAPYEYNQYDYKQQPLFL